MISKRFLYFNIYFQLGMNVYMTSLVYFDHYITYLIVKIISRMVLFYELIVTYIFYL